MQFMKESGIFEHPHQAIQVRYAVRHGRKHPAVGIHQRRAGEAPVSHPEGSVDPS